MRWDDPEYLQILEEGADSKISKDKQPIECVKISVSDTGIGLNVEDRDRVFRAFEQADGSASRRYQGTGLGLSLTKRLESDGEGKGSTFCFVIPVDPKANPSDLGLIKQSFSDGEPATEFEDMNEPVAI